MPGRDDSERGPSHVVADNLAAELARRRMSGRQAAAQMGLSVAYVARRISGDTAIDIDDLYAFANLLDVDVSVLLDGAGPKSPVSPMVRFADGSGFSVNEQPTDYRVADSSEVVDMFTREPIRAAG